MTKKPRPIETTPDEVLANGRKDAKRLGLDVVGIGKPVRKPTRRRK